MAVSWRNSCASLTYAAFGSVCRGVPSSMPETRSNKSAGGKRTAITAFEPSTEPCLLAKKSAPSKPSITTPFEPSISFMAGSSASSDAGTSSSSCTVEDLTPTRSKKIVSSSQGGAMSYQDIQDKKREQNAGSLEVSLSYANVLFYRARDVCIQLQTNVEFNVLKPDHLHRLARYYQIELVNPPCLQPSHPDDFDTTKIIDATIMSVAMKYFIHPNPLRMVVYMIIESSSFERGLVCDGTPSPMQIETALETHRAALMANFGA